jgi:hypothetical protein
MPPCVRDSPQLPLGVQSVVPWKGGEGGGVGHYNRTVFANTLARASPVRVAGSRLVCTDEPRHGVCLMRIAKLPTKHA